MTKKRQHNSAAKDERPHNYPPPRPGVDTVAMATLGLGVAILMISFSNWREIDRIQNTLDGKLGQIDTRVVQLAEKVDNMPSQAAPAQAPRRGPDPNRVYQIKTAGAPAKGPSTAAVTIAEFSDFQ